MGLQKQSIPFNFAAGLSTKTDPKQISLGQFLSLQNSVFTKGGLLGKRYGYGSLPSLPNNNSTYLTTFGGNLTALGTSVNAYAAGSQSWVNKGTFQPISLSTLPVVRSSLNQTQCDSVIAPNNFVCTVYTEVNNGVSAYKYVIQDSVTGQNIVAPAVIPVSSGAVTGSPRVFLLGGSFIVVFTNVISSTSHLQFIAIATNTGAVIKSNTDIASAYVAKTTLSWDGVVVGANLYVAYNLTSGGQAINVTYLTQAFTVATPVAFSSSICTIMSMCADLTNASKPLIYAAFWDAAGSTGNAVAVDQNLNKLMTATEWLATGSVDNVTCTATAGILTIAYENANVYSYDNTIASNYLAAVTVTQPATVTTGTVGSAATFLRSVGLASKAFLMNSVMYMLTAYDGKSTTVAAFQPTYFLVNISGQVISRFAYENGGGYLTTGLPQAQVIGSAVSIAYLYKDLITSVNKTQGVTNAAGVYSQTGVNLVTLNYTAATLSTSELGSNLNISGGMLMAYDGNTLSEQNFHLYPDSIEVTLVADPAPTGTVSNVTNPTIITAVSSVAGIAVGMNISGSGIPANTTVIAVGTNTVTMSASATAAHSAETITFTGNMAAQAYYYQVIYQETDTQGNIVNSAPSIPVTMTASSGHSSVVVAGPYMRLTYKSNSKIIIYRWSAAQEDYYQITSITAPLLNSTTSDSWSFADIQSDASILGNGQIYTNGGVVEDVAGPACTALTIFDTRLWAIDAEDQNLLWFSKQVIEGTPVEMSDLMTLYIAPNTGTTISTGPLKCIAPMDDKLIMFKANALYYINGTGPDNTDSNSQYSQPIFITSSIGSVNQSSIVLTPNGLMFQSDKGIWLLDRNLGTTYIGAPVEAFNSYTVNSAQNLPGTTMVVFTLSSGITLMYDYFYNQWGEWVGVPAISSTVYNGAHTYLNKYGAVAQQTSGAYLDNGNPVLMQFKTGWLNLAGLQGYQRAFFFYLLAEYITPHKLAVSIAYDYNPAPEQLTVIQPTNFNAMYGGQGGPYGQGTYGGNPSEEQWRVFMTKQRCQSFQIAVQEIYDQSLGVQAGAGFTMSGINLVIAMKKGWRPISSAQSTGGQQ